MSLLQNIVGGLRGLFHKQEQEQQLDEELQAYVELAAESKIQNGLNRAEAIQAARAEMGSMTSVKEQTHQAGWESTVQDFASDLRFGARMLRRNPGVTLVVVLTLALGIGMNTGIFTILNSAGMRLLPVPQAQDLAVVSQNFDKSRVHVSRNVHNNESYFSYSEYFQYHDHNQVFSGLLAYSPFVLASLSGDHPQELMGTLASCNYFQVLEVVPQLGHAFSDADCRAEGSNAVVVLGANLWRTAFNADPNIIGKTVRLNRVPFVVAGVAPAQFQGTELVQSQFWAPVTMQSVLMRNDEYLKDDQMSWLGLIGRIKPGVSKDQVRADLAVIAARIDQLQPGRVTTIQASRATLFAVPEERLVLLGTGGVLMLAVSMVLLIACANVANLLLARAVVRQKEIAVKRALGATRWRLVRQLLTESLLMAVIGGVLGSIVAIWFASPLLKILLSHLPAEAPPLALSTSADLRVLGFAVGLSLITGIAFGLAPALHATRASLMLAMKEEGAETMVASKRSGWLRNVLVSAQITVCMVLLIVAGLLLRGLQRTHTIDPGFSMKNTAVISFDLVAAGYNQPRAVEFQQQLKERISAIPGIDLVAQTGVSPLSDDHRGNRYSVPENNASYQIEHNRVSASYFPLLGIPIVRGRNFTQAEISNGSPVVIMTESTARRLWPNQNPIGKIMFEEPGKNNAALEVIGITKDSQVSRLGETNTMYLFRPAGPKEQGRIIVMAHAGNTFDTSMKEMRTAVQQLDPELFVKVTRLEDNMNLWRMLSLIPSVLSAALGALALLLASIGVYGMVAYAVSRRIREIGIRMALGASGGNIRSLIVRQGMRPVVVGAGIGILCCAAISNFMSSVLYGVSPWDPISFLFVPGFLFAVALVACWLPARKAARVDPMESLRQG
jgi:macrolide transport system ATP-binding/permease protein